jgi:hypothetical protein
MSMMNRRALTLMAGLATLALSACSGVGDGNSLQSLVIVSSANSAVTFDELEAGGDTDTNAYECLASGLKLFGLFNKDDSAGDFTSRATWSSANPAIAKISNGDVPIPGSDGLFFAYGIIVPVAPGSTVVTAKYLDLTADITVHVQAAGALTIEPQNPRLAVNTRQGFVITTVIDGIKYDVTAIANPTVAFSPVADTIATVGYSSGFPFVTALANTGPLNLNFTLPACNQTLTTTVRVAPITALTITHEPGFGGEIVVKTNEKLKTMADFGDGPEQDVSAAATYTVSGDTTATDRVVPLINYVGAVSAGSAVSISAKCCALDRTNDGDTADADEAASDVASNALSITPVAGTLGSFSIAPLNASVAQYTDQQFTAIGQFSGDGGTTHTQPITRYVAWSQTDPATSLASPLLSIGTSSVTNPNAGLASTPRSPFVDNKITAATPLTISATPIDSIQPDTDLPAQTTTLTLTPLAAAP